MSNRYFEMQNFQMFIPPSLVNKRHFAKGKSLEDNIEDVKKERLNRVEDITELPKRIYKNNMFRHQVLLSQQARNYSREKERLMGEINSHRIPANRARIQRRIDYLDGMIKEYDGLLQDENKKFIFI